MKDKSKAIILSAIGILSLVIITVGVTYAVFTYTKLGSTENTITAGTIKFEYTENTGIGAGIELTNALPVADDVAMEYSTEGKVFDFKVTGDNASSELIPYEVTLRQSDESTLDGYIIKVYLTDMNEGADTEILAPTKYTLLPDTTIDTGKYTEKTLYTGSVAAGETGYEKNFRLRMWVDETADFSAIDHYKNTTDSSVITENEYASLDDTTKANYTIVTHINTADNTMYTQAEYDLLEDKTNVESIANAPVYPYNGKTFKALVNIYANAEVVADGE